jgi:division protein CdvB (Snf7/Vps24/ESCRT-III family)
LVDSIIGDTLDTMDGEGIETEADKEVDKIVAELTAGILAPAANAPESKIKRAAAAAAAEPEPAEAAEDSEELKAMQARLMSL